METESRELHPSLPKTLTPELLANWLKQNAKEKFTDEQKHYYTPDELAELKDNAVTAGIEINKLGALKGELVKLIDKGCEEYKPYEIYETPGIDALKKTRQRNETAVETGYELVKLEIFGIPNQDTKSMDYFDIEGNEIPDRCRPLSTKEVREYVSQFTMQLNEKQG
jgi:hypothetical protein